MLRSASAPPNTSPGPDSPVSSALSSHTVTSVMAAGSEPISDSSQYSSSNRNNQAAQAALSSRPSRVAYGATRPASRAGAVACRRARSSGRAVSPQSRAHRSVATRAVSVAGCRSVPNGTANLGTTTGMEPSSMCRVNQYSSKAGCTCTRPPPSGGNAEEARAPVTYHGAVITASHVEVRVGARVLLQDASFRVGPGDRIGLVGRNGAGKTTLTKMLAGEGLPAAGAITRSGQVGYLPQDPRTGDLDVIARDRILSARGLDEAVRRMRAAEQGMGSANAAEHDKAMRRYANAETAFLAAGGYSAESEAAVIAASLGLPDRVLDQPRSEEHTSELQSRENL